MRNKISVCSNWKLIKWYVKLKKLLKKKNTRPITERNYDVFDPSSLVMDSECSDTEVGCDFSFAFNDSHFSDRLLHIYVSSEPMDSPSAVKVQTLHISSPILAARSPFFFKLFSNGMKESEQRNVTLQINASEEASFMELLHFMYSNNMTVTTVSTVLDVLVVANKFDVASCMRHCSRLLRNLTMTHESVLVYLDLPSTVLMSQAFCPLTVAATQFLFVHFNEKIKFEDEILSLPLAVLEVIIASDDLCVVSEDSVYCFVLNWARAHYPKLRDRRAVIATHLAKFIRYPYMTHKFLGKLLSNKEFDPEFAKKVVSEAKSFKAEVPHDQHTYIIDKSSSSIHNRLLVERTYVLRPIKMVKFEQPCPRCVVYLDLKHDLCASLSPSESVISEDFNFSGGQKFCLWAERNVDSFGLRLGMWKGESCPFAFDFTFAVRSKPVGEFVSRYETTTWTCTGNLAVGWPDYFEIPYTRFIAEDSVYFIDGVFHLKVELTKVTG